jgi:uncharacterized phage-associated protein
MPPTLNYDKLEQVLHYIIQKVGSSPHVGKTVLFKLLYFCDFNYYEKYEEYLTGEQYYKLSIGPAPSHFDEIIDMLKEKNKITVLNTEYHGYKQEKFLSIDEPDISSLSANELSVIDSTIEQNRLMNASQISAFSHADMPWKATEDREIIDYNLVFYRSPLTSVVEEEDEV